MRYLFKSRGLLLSVGSGVASMFNFYSFLIFPSLVGTKMLESFAQDNYLGGFYLFGVGSSIAPLSVFILTSGRRIALKRYVLLSIFSLLAVCLSGYWLARLPWSYFCLLGAVCLHTAGFFLASLISDERIVAASVLQTVQPGLFAVFISLETVWAGVPINWSVAYLLSTLVSLSLFLAASNITRLWQLLAQEPTDVPSWGRIMSRVLLCVSFPLFFQLEQILCGKFSTASLGEYVMLQKLYSSISTSLFGSLGVLMLSRKLQDRQENFIDSKVLLIALASAVCVLMVGTVVIYTGRAALLSVPLVAGCAVVAFFFTLCSFLGLMLVAIRPFLGLQILGFSFVMYLVSFWVWRPNSEAQLLFFAGGFFCTFFIIASWISSRSRYYAINP